MPWFRGKSFKIHFHFAETYVKQVSKKLLPLKKLDGYPIIREDDGDEEEDDEEEEDLEDEDSDREEDEREAKEEKEE